jgi:hypothetical protein
MSSESVSLFFLRPKFALHITSPSFKDVSFAHYIFVDYRACVRRLMGNPHSQGCTYVQAAILAKASADSSALGHFWYPKNHPDIPRRRRRNILLYIDTLLDHHGDTYTMNIMGTNLPARAMQPTSKVCSKTDSTTMT